MIKYKLKCKNNHEFHIKCIDEWLSKQKDSCPVCRCEFLGPDKNEKPDEEYYLEKNVETRWRSVLSQKDILLIETIFFNFMKEFHYKFDNKMNILKKIKGFYYFFTLYLEQDKYAYLKGIIILRNIIRRLMILSFNYKVANLFRFK